MKKGIDKSKRICYTIKVVSERHAGMAQSVEHVIGNDEVISSILITSSKSPLQSQRTFLMPSFNGVDKFTFK